MSSPEAKEGGQLGRTWYAAAGRATAKKVAEHPPKRACLYRNVRLDRTGSPF